MGKLDTLGQRRINRKNEIRRMLNMLFVDLVHVIHPYLMKDGDVPTFVKT